VPSSAEEVLENMPGQRLKGGNPTTGLRGGRLVTHPRELKLLPGHNVKTKEDGQLLSENGKKKEEKYRIFSMDC